VLKHPQQPRYQHKIMGSNLLFFIRRKVDQQTLLENSADSATEIEGGVLTLHA